MVLETAVNGGADRIATFNIKHLADLASRDAAGDDAIIRLNAIRGSSRIRALIAFVSSR